MHLLSNPLEHPTPPFPTLRGERENEPGRDHVAGGSVGAGHDPGGGQSEGVLFVRRERVPHYHLPVLQHQLPSTQQSRLSSELTNSEQQRLGNRFNRSPVEGF